ncbi:MAG: DNA topology modulation protein FlaR [Actinomycetota bacterium]
MDRVVVVGPGGAGKSTFARALGACIDAPVVHLDQHFWKPGWVETPRDEFAAHQQTLFAADRWIADGNYGGTFDVRLERADTVVVLVPGRVRCVLGAATRTLRNYGDDVQAAGCPERVSLDFYRWIWNYDRDSRPRLDAAIGRHPHLDVVELQSRTAAGEFIDGLNTSRSSRPAGE